MNVKKNYFILCLVYFLIFFANALFLSFFQIFLMSKGFKESEIGVISSITPLLCIIANPLYSLIGKNNKRIRFLLLALSVLEALVILLVYQTNQYSMLILVMCLVAIVDPPLFVIMDSYASSFIKEHNKNYSYIRITGTLAYAIGAFVCGLFVEYIGYDVVFISASILMFLSVILILLLKPIKDKEDREKKDVKELVTNKGFIIFAIYFIFILAFAQLGDTYISIYLTNELEVSEFNFGIINSLWVIIELLVVLILNKFKIKNEYILLILMGVCYLSRIIVIGLEGGKEIAILSALLRGVGMGINIYLYVPILVKIVKESNISIALLMIAMFKSLLATLFISISGFMIESVGYSFIFIIWSIIFVVVIIGYSLFSRKYLKLN